MQTGATDPHSEPHPIPKTETSGSSRASPKKTAYGAPSFAQQLPGMHHIELNLRDLDQLFNTMDPSPFHEKDLDHDAEEFILGWAREFPLPEPVNLIIHLEQLSESRDPQHLAEDAIHNYFAYRTRLNELEFKRLMKQGRTSLVVGLSFLAICFLTIRLALPEEPSTLSSFFKEGLTIAGWVAMWKPLEIYLYDWWPLRRRGQLFEKLSRMPVEVRKRG
jgi:hypothetical protein